MKRSSQVALLLMGATGVGASAYALTPPRCPPAANPPAAVAPAEQKTTDAERCQPRRGWGAPGWTRTNSTSHWRRPAFTRTSTNPRVSTIPTTSTPKFRAPTPSVPRSGFGSTGRQVSTSS